MVEQKKFYDYWIPIKNFDLLSIEKIKLYIMYQMFFRNTACDRKVAKDNQYIIFMMVTMSTVPSAHNAEEILLKKENPFT